MSESNEMPRRIRRMKLSDVTTGAVFRITGTTQTLYRAPWSDAAPYNRRGMLAADMNNIGPDTEVDVIWSPAPPAEPKADIVERPAHYARLSPEPLDVIQRWGLNFCRGSALKYIARAGYKPGADEVTDLRKAVVLLQREIERARSNDPSE